MTIPPNFGTSNSSLVCHLSEALYGLVSLVVPSNAHLLVSFGFSASQRDLFLFIQIAKTSCLNLR